MKTNNRKAVRICNKAIKNAQTFSKSSLATNFEKQQTVFWRKLKSKVAYK